MSKKVSNKDFNSRILEKTEKVLNTFEMSFETAIIEDLSKKLSMIKLIDKHLSSKIERLIPPKVSVKPKNVSNGTLCLMISDVHIGKKNLNYNMDLFKEKLGILFDGVVSELKTKQIRKLQVFLLGDILDGFDVFVGHKNNLCLGITEQIVNGAFYLSNFINDLTSYCDEINVSCCPGNHGRIGRKGESTITDNYDTIMYHMIKTHLKNNSRVNIFISEDWKMFVPVEQLTIMAFHGDDTVQGKPLNNLPKAITAWSDIFNSSKIDAAICGHYHTPVLGVDVNGKELFINGSFVPIDDYVEKKIREKSKCGQVCFVVQGNKIKDRNLIELP